MEKRIRITAGSVSAEGALNESATAENIWAALPISASANTWGEEIYFYIPVTDAPAPDAREVVDMGELGYWPPGKAFCVFFGPTPASQGNEIRAASPVNPVGSLFGDAAIFKKVKNGDSVIIEKA